MSFGAVASAGDPLKRGLVGWYRMLGNANDSSGRGNTGTLVGSPTAAADKFGTASSAYGLTDSPRRYILLTDPFFTGANSVSLAAWVKAASAASNRLYVQGWSDGINPLFLFEGASSIPRFFMRNNSATVITDAYATKSAFDNQWHHVALTLSNSGTSSFYVDGANAGNFTYTAQVISEFNTAAIGTFFRLGVASGGFTGSVFDFRVYNRTLTAAEVGTLYRATQRI